MNTRPWSTAFYRRWAELAANKPTQQPAADAPHGGAMDRGHEIAHAEFNRHRAAAGAPPSTRTLTELISTRLAVTAARPGEQLGNAAALARDVVASLPLDEQATIALADGAHKGKLDELERKITIHLDHVTDDAERKRLQAAIADLRRAIANAS